MKKRPNTMSVVIRDTGLMPTSSWTAHFSWYRFFSGWEGLRVWEGAKMKSNGKAFESITEEFETVTALADYLALDENQKLFDQDTLDVLNLYAGVYGANEGTIETFSFNYSNLVPGPSDAVAPPTEFPTLKFEVKIEYVEQATKADILAFYDSLETAVTDAGGSALFTGNLDGDEDGISTHIVVRKPGKDPLEYLAITMHKAADDGEGGIDLLAWSWGMSQSGTFNGSVEIGEFNFQFDGTSNPAVPLATLFSLYGGPFLTAEASESAAADIYMKLDGVGDEGQGAIYGPDASGEYTVELATVEDASVPALRELFEQLLQETDASLI